LTSLILIDRERKVEKKVSGQRKKERKTEER
jgi:hypothetical protein